MPATRPIYKKLLIASVLFVAGMWIGLLLGLTHERRVMLYMVEDVYAPDEATDNLRAKMALAKYAKQEITEADIKDLLKNNNTLSAAEVACKLVPRVHNATLLLMVEQTRSRRLLKSAILDHATYLPLTIGGPTDGTINEFRVLIAGAKTPDDLAKINQQIVAKYSVTGPFRHLLSFH